MRSALAQDAIGAGHSSQSEIMSENDKSIWTRHHYLPNLTRFLLLLFSARMLRRYCFCLVSLATIVAFFYAEEDLRGKHAWTSYMRQSKAKGIELDWHAYVPPAVPDDQNFAMTPPFDKMFSYEWKSNKVQSQDTNIWSRIEWASLWFRPLAPKLRKGLPANPVAPKLAIGSGNILPRHHRSNGYFSPIARTV
jgi:hypothetical protein